MTVTITETSNIRISSFGTCRRNEETVVVWWFRIDEVVEQRQKSTRSVACIRSSKIDVIANEKTANRKSSLWRLNPVLRNGLLCVGGRLKHSNFNEQMKYPIILPRKSCVTELIVQDHHERTGHSGINFTLSSLRERFWVIKGGAMVRRVVGKCLKCSKRNASKGVQMMADLPSQRITPGNAPFYFTGVDYFGPMIVKQGRSTVKRWGCLFTCLTTRAVHIEISSSLSTDSFINCLRRFMSRRGKPREIFSDNGTNFVGTISELSNLVSRFDQQSIIKSLNCDNILWRFNPPGASHFGGIWERMIRSVRKILSCLLQEQLVTDDTLHTLVVEVESILNNRPLIPMSDDPTQSPLTPNKLLLLKDNHCQISDPVYSRDMLLKKRWKHAQYLADQFWIRWKKDYVPLLQSRNKWLRPIRNLDIGDVVLVVYENLKRGQWPLGIVEKVYPDSNGLVRQADVRYNGKVSLKPISKLCLLELVN